MPRFVFAYHGGGSPETPEEQEKVMGQWMSWIGGHGAAFVDPGAPVGLSKTVSAKGIANDGGANPLSGYSVVEAADMDAALAIAKGCPIIGEGTVEVAEVFKM